jgi:purine-cytosine permease-like protein
VVAINNVIAASVLVRAFGPSGAERGWAAALGILATLIVARGPVAVRLADRVAVPVMLVVGAALTWALWQQPQVPARTEASITLWRGFDIVVGYQVSWLLMFADYSRYTPSPSRAGVSTFLGLFVTSLWFMPLGFVAARLAGSLDPGLMLDASGIGSWGAILLALATLTTNFVNVYMSALAWKSLVPAANDQLSVWSIGGIGTALTLFSTTWLERYADFMLLLGAVLIPVGGVLIAHYVILRRSVRVPDLYDERGPFAVTFGLQLPGIIAWTVGIATYFAASTRGSTLPAMVMAVVTYLFVERLFRSRRPRAGTPAREQRGQRSVS